LLLVRRDHVRLDQAGAEMCGFRAMKGFS